MRLLRIRLAASCAALAIVSWLVLPVAVTGGQPAGQPTPESVGLSSSRLAKIGKVMHEQVDAGRIAGAVTLVERNGRVAHLEAAGNLDVERHAPMPVNAIFRIASMSKAITSVAIMMLVEDGRMGLGDPVSKFIPAFATTTVRAADGSAPVPAKRPITIRDLLTHTSGLSYGGGPIADRYKAAGFTQWYFADKSEPIGTWIERLATLPFESQPGERYVYGYSIDVLGYVVEKASARPFDEFLRARVFEPLKMIDTSFFLPEDKENRFAAVYSAGPDGRIQRSADPIFGQGAYVRGPRRAFSGGAGLLSTASDYGRFLQMLLNGGELDGARLLSPKTVELMTSNHVGQLYQDGRFGFGLGFEIVEDIGRAGRYGSPGAFGWGGAYFTQFWADPHEKLAAVFMTQLLPSGGLNLQETFRTLVYQSIVAAPDGTPLRSTARDLHVGDAR